MPDAALDEARPVRDKPEPLPEAQRALLRVHVHHSGRSIREHVLYEQRAQRLPPIRQRHRDALDLPTSLRGPRACGGHALLP